MAGSRTCRCDLLVPWIQQVGKLGAAPGDARADGSGRDAQSVSDLGVVQVTQVAQHHGDTKLLGQAGQGLVDCHAVREGLDASAGSGTDVSGPGGVKIVGQAWSGPPLPAPQLVKACVRGYPVGPGGEGGTAVEASDAACDRDERLLGSVQGVGFVACEAAADGVDAVVVTAEERVEGSAVTRLGGAHQRWVVGLRGDECRLGGDAMQNGGLDRHPGFGRAAATIRDPHQDRLSGGVAEVDGGRARAGLSTAATGVPQAGKDPGLLGET